VTGAAVLAAARPGWLPDMAELAAAAAAELAALRADYPGWDIDEDGGLAAAGLGIAARSRLVPARCPVTAATADGMRAALAAAEAPPPPAPVGTVYLLHFSAPLGHARHYTGWSAHLDWRLRQHRAGRSGVPLVRAAVAAGIELELARTWPAATRAFERRLKNRHGAAAYCPLCAAERRAGAIARGGAVLAGAAL
jgi:hypothetical protein